MRVVVACSLVLLAGCSSASADGVASEGGLTDPQRSAADPPATVPTAPVGPQDPLALRFAYVQHLGTLTDPPPPCSAGTDLGSSFVHDGQLLFLFGDSLTSDPALHDRDSVARAPLSLPASGLPALDFVTNGDGRIRPLDVPGIALGTMNVPVDGFVKDGVPYVFFASGFDFPSGTYTRSTLAHGTGGSLVDLTLDHDVATSKFANVSVIVEDDQVYVYGTGRYRQSSVYLARVPIADVATREKWTYRAADGSFALGEDSAAPLIQADCAGELSARRHPRLPIVLLTYACGSDPRGVRLHLAASPEGPFSAPQNVYEPGDGYGLFIHQKESVVGYDDGLAPLRGAGSGLPEADWGGEYAPYLVTPWFHEDPDGAAHVVFTMSSWVPYRVHLMDAVLAPPGVTATRPAKGQGLKTAIANGTFDGGSLSGWTVSGTPMRTWQDPEGRWRATSYATGDADTGTLEQPIAVDATARELSFWVAGGDATVELRRGDTVLRRATGRRSNDAHRVRWRLDDLRGETLRIVIDDHLTTPWGFVEAFGFAIDAAD
jgi:hypothetical protein